MGTGPEGAAGVAGVVVGCARVAEAADALAGRVRSLPPPTWTGPAADGLADGVGRAVRLLDDAGAALHEAGTHAGRVGAR